MAAIGVQLSIPVMLDDRYVYTAQRASARTTLWGLHSIVGARVPSGARTCPQGRHPGTDEHQSMLDTITPTLFLEGPRSCSRGTRRYAGDGRIPADATSGSIAAGTPGAEEHECAGRATSSQAARSSFFRREHARRSMRRAGLTSPASRRSTGISRSVTPVALNTGLFGNQKA